MTRLDNHDERGASLVLAIVFLVVVGAIAVSTMAMVTSALKNRGSLDTIRDREYAADGAINSAVAQLRSLAPATLDAQLVGSAPCAPSYYTYTPKSIDMRVDCVAAPAVTRSMILQRNVILTACVKASPDVACGSNNGPSVIIRAQVNFQAVGSGASLVVSRTWIQSWSVNG